LVGASASEDKFTKLNELRKDLTPEVRSEP